MPEDGQIIDRVQDGIITVEMDGSIEYWSKGAEEIFGYTADEIVGRFIAQLCERGEAEALDDAVRNMLFAQAASKYLLKEDLLRSSRWKYAVARISGLGGASEV
ncbi:MAG TPA: PAS domain-containing protein [Rhodothermia bacterium]|nr:PAS domain-containing protein [Rhodothermia bacterium]